MASRNRIRGQEVRVLIVRGGVLENELTDIMSFNLELEGEIKSQGFLGERSNRKDDIYNGVKFDMELQLHSGAGFAFVKAVKARQQRLDPTLIINISCVIELPSGGFASALIPDARFGPFPFNVAGRPEYMKLKLQGEADDVEIDEAA
jgi:hypothetical protein